jgi:hypothetical protein
MTRSKFEALNKQQRGWIQKAADLGVKASLEATYDESSIAQELCTRGVRFKDATPAQLLALRTRLAPILDRLAADPHNGSLLAKIKAATARTPANETLIVDDDCRQGVSSDDSAANVPKSAAAIPDGDYRVQITSDEVEAAGLDNRDGTSGLWTFTVSDGRYAMRCQPIASPGLDCGHSTQSGPLDEGNLRGKGDLAYLASDAGHVVELQWALTSGGLRFTNDTLRVAFELVLKPWQKIQ